MDPYRLFYKIRNKDVFQIDNGDDRGYGEIDDEGFCELLEAASVQSLQPGEVFIDLGSGKGIPAFIAAFINPRITTMSVELSNYLHNTALNMKKQFIAAGLPFAERCRFYHRDLKYLDFIQGQGVVYSFNKLFSVELRSHIRKLIADNELIRCYISNDNNVIPGFRLTKVAEVNLQSYDAIKERCCFYIQERIRTEEMGEDGTSKELEDDPFVEQRRVLRNGKQY